MKKRFLVVLMTAILTIGLAACGGGGSSDSIEGMTPGTYTASAQGIHGDVTVEVEVDESSILSVKVVEHQETEGISDPAIERIPSNIVEQQSVEVEPISGATVTSNAIIEAVKDCLKQAGADM